MATALLVVMMVLVCPAGSWSGALEAVPDLSTRVYSQQEMTKIELGKKLFFDRRLSGDGTMNCGTCHDPEKGFSDGLAVSLHYPTTRNWRNSPTLFNVALQQSLFHDGRAPTLEEQALFPMMSAFEMNQNLEYLEEEIRTVPEYVTAFTEVFGDGDVTKERIAMAIAAFERTILSRDAPLDRFLRGDATALSPAAREGYALFTGKGQCTTCHYGANLMDDLFHALHVPENPEHLKDPRITATRRFVAKVYQFPEYRTLAEDPGRYLITGEQKDWKAFKTPTLREIAVTAPYMHNGLFTTLAEVIDFFDKGGGEGATAIRPLHLTDHERRALQTFLEEALTGSPTTFTYPKIP